MKNGSLAAIIGQRFNKLMVLGDAPKIGKQPAWETQCECGIRSIKQAWQVKNGLIRTCGNCKRVKNASGTAEYRAWRDAVRRCTNPASHAWEHYGGRGIGFWPAWQRDFAAFLEHIGPKPHPKLTLERINNDRGYEPGNVKWATRREQALNQRNRQKRQFVPDWQI